MTLDIIVPHYKEDTKTLMTALSSIDNQVNHKFKTHITVVTDLGGVEIDKEAIKKVIKMPITFITTDKHSGPGYARQYAMNKTTGDYIIFCDSDDMFASPFAFCYFYDCLKKDPDLEIIFTAYLEEYISDTIQYRQKDDDISITTLHGKMYKRKFIYDNNITFTNWMMGEDGAFNFKAICFAKKVIFNDDAPTYIWRFNPKSLTHSNTKFVNMSVNLRAFLESIETFEYFFDVIINEKNSQITWRLIPSFINSLQQQLVLLKQIPNLDEEAVSYIQRTEERLNQCREKYKRYL